MRPSFRAVLTFVPTAAVLLGLAWVFGLPELAALVVAGALALVATAVWVRVHRVPPQMQLRVEPTTSDRDSPAQLVATVTNDRDRTSAAVRLHGELATAGRGILAVGPLRPGEATELRVALPTPRRGVFVAGPLTWSIGDPLGWWNLTGPAAATAELRVRPRVHRLDGRLGRDPERTAPGGPQGGYGARDDTDSELVGLRAYVRGDDLRMIHWRTSARRGEPHVVQVEPHTRPRSVLALLDLRSTDPVAFELAVEACASVLSLACSEGLALRLVTTDGDDSGRLEPHQVDRALDQLAGVHAVRPEHRRGVDPTDALWREPERVAAVACTAATDIADLMSAPVDIVVWSTDSTVPPPTAPVPPPTAPVPPPTAGGPLVVRWGAGQDLVDAWSAAWGATTAGAPAG